MKGSIHRTCFMLRYCRPEQTLATSMKIKTVGLIVLGWFRSRRNLVYMWCCFVGELTCDVFSVEVSFELVIAHILIN